MRLIKNLPLRVNEAITRALEMTRIHFSTLDLSQQQAEADVRCEMVHGREEWMEAEGEWILVGCWSVPQLTDTGVKLKAFLLVWDSFFEMLREELWYALSGNLPEWLKDERQAMDRIYA